MKTRRDMRSGKREETEDCYDRPDAEARSQSSTPSLKRSMIPAAATPWCRNASASIARLAARLPEELSRIERRVMTESAFAIPRPLGRRETIPTASRRKTLTLRE